MLDDTRLARRALLAHLDTFWQLNDKAMLAPTDAMVAERLPHLRIARMSPSGQAEPWAHVTVGAWELTAASGRGWEFMLLAPTDEPAAVETLTAVVRRHLFSPLDAGEILDLGRSWHGEGACTHLLACPPYAYSASLEHLELDGLAVRVLWMVPITEREAAFARAEGVEALEQRLQDHAVEFLDARRASVV